MRTIILLITLTTLLLGCQSEVEHIKTKFLVDEVPKNTPINFKQDLVPSDKLIHKGVFSPDLEEYYYTISDKDFEQFDVYVIKKENGHWSEAEPAFFNSKYNEHGMSFSPDGNSIYFSSTRPVDIDGVAPTWHIWRSDKVEGKWNTPVYIDIVNLRDKLVSHPTIANSGTLYFHVSNLDYSDMDIYSSKQVNGRFQIAEKTPISVGTDAGKCTPYVSPQEDYLIFASIGNQLDLMISYNDGSGNWINTRRLNNQINNLGQGNPYVTPDNNFLFFTTGDHQEKDWRVKWVNFGSELKEDPINK